jgi:hypothetical protein
VSLSFFHPESSTRTKKWYTNAAFYLAMHIYK